MQVNTSHLAIQDIEEIWNFIADVDFNKADAFVVDLSRTARLFASSPNAGRACDYLISGMRRFRFRKYMVYYFAESNGIEIYRVLHSSRNIEGMFEDYFENL